MVAVEPDPGNVALMKKNVAPYPNCVVVDAAIGSERGFASLGNSGDGLAWTVQTTRAGAGVPVITEEDALAASGGDELLLVKIDIEGFESDLFASNLDWLERVHALFIEPHDWMFPGRRTSGNFQEAMARLPFELFIIGDNLAYVRT